MQKQCEVFTKDSVGKVGFGMNFLTQNPQNYVNFLTQNSQNNMNLLPLCANTLRVIASVAKQSRGQNLFSGLLRRSSSQ